MNKPTSTTHHLNTLIVSRQEVYETVFVQRRDALFNTLDALLSGDSWHSFAYLSQSERFERKWGSLYDTLQDGRLNTEALHQLLVRHLPSQGVCVFALDGSCWPRPRSRVFKDLQYAHQSDANGGHITIGYPYSLLEWCAQPHTRWSSPLELRRIVSEQTAQEVGIAQIHALAAARAGCVKALDIVAADGKYGNGRFLSGVSGLRVGIVARVRCDRVLYRSADCAVGRRGRPRKYGERFAFKEAQTWAEPDEVEEFVDGRYGKVCLQRWPGLLDRRAGGLSCDVVRAQVHLERERPPAPIWLV